MNNTFTYTYLQHKIIQGVLVGMKMGIPPFTSFISLSWGGFLRIISICIRRPTPAWKPASTPMSALETRVGWNADW